MEGMDITLVQKRLQKATLAQMARCYRDYSLDWDARKECSDFEAKIESVQNDAKSETWAAKIFWLRDVKLTPLAAKYFRRKAQLEALIKAAEDYCQQRASVLDRKIQDFLDEDHDLDWCKRLPTVYQTVAKFSGDVRSRCKNLDRLQELYDQREDIRLANMFDNAVMRLGELEVGQRLAEAKKLETRYLAFSGTAKALCKQVGQLRSIILECSGKIAQHRDLCRRQAKQLDDTFAAFPAKMSDEQIRQGWAFIQTYSETPEEVKSFCELVTQQTIEEFRTRLEDSRIENGHRRRAADLDARFAALFPVQRSESYFAQALGFVSELQATDRQITAFCTAATTQAVENLLRTIDREKKYLQAEETIEQLARRKNHSEQWCQKCHQIYQALSPDKDKYRNGDLLEQLRADAVEIHADIVCAPFRAALEPNSDFREVFALDKTLAQFAERSILEQNIPSFADQWSHRLEQAKAASKEYARDKAREARELFAKGDRAQSFRLCEEAEQYDSECAAFLLGEHYRLGDPIGRDLTKAMYYYKVAYGAGETVAAFAIAAYFKETDPKGFVWKERAVRLGSKKERVPLAIMYLKGVGVAQDNARAYELFNAVAEETSDQTACAYLGGMYERGRSVAVDRSRAVEYYKRAPDVPWAQAACQRLEHILEEEALDLEVSQNLARATAGEAEAQFFMGDCYFFGYRTKQSYSEAIEWFQKAAVQGHGRASARLGDIYCNSLGVPNNLKNLRKAKKYYLDAIKHGA